MEAAEEEQEKRIDEAVKEALRNERANNKKVKKERKKRQPSKYNEFVKDAIAKLKVENPSLSHDMVFKMAAERWKVSPENPKAQKQHIAMPAGIEEQEREQQAVADQPHKGVDKGGSSSDEDSSSDDD